MFNFISTNQMVFQDIAVQMMNISFGILIFQLWREFIRLSKNKIGMVQSTLERVKTLTSDRTYFERKDILDKAISLDTYQRNVSYFKIAWLSFAVILYVFIYFASLIHTERQALLFMLFIMVVIITIMTIVFDIITRAIIDEKWLEIYEAVPFTT